MRCLGAHAFTLRRQFTSSTGCAEPYLLPPGLYSLRPSPMRWVLGLGVGRFVESRVRRTTIARPALRRSCLPARYARRWGVGPTLLLRVLRQFGGFCPRSRVYPGVGPFFLRTMPTPSKPRRQLDPSSEMGGCRRGVSLRLRCWLISNLMPLGPAGDDSLSTTLNARAGAGTDLPHRQSPGALQDRVPNLRPVAV